MSTRESFESWAISVQLSTTRYEALGSYAFYETRKAWESYQAATSRQEAKVKALVEAIKHIKAHCDNCVTVYDECDKAIAAAKE